MNKENTNKCNLKEDETSAEVVKIYQCLCDKSFPDTLSKQMNCMKGQPMIRNSRIWGNFCEYFLRKTALKYPIFAFVEKLFPYVSLHRKWLKP